MSLLPGPLPRLLCCILLGGATAWAGATDGSSPAPDPLAPLIAKPLYQFTETEVGLYLGHLQKTEPDLRRRVLHLARKNIGQPYDLYLLGEMPFETHDPQPLYCLTKSDCVVFSEHVYAMALSSDWTGFMRLLQRIRYKDGEIGVVTRNHYTESDWNPSNRWLVRDATAELAGGKAVRFEGKIDRARFLLSRYKLTVEHPVVHHQDLYLPYTEVARVLGKLKEGDFINVVRGVVRPDAPVNDTFGGNAWIGHVGIVAHGPDGTLNMIHSAEPAVREEPLAEFIARGTADLAAKDAAGKPRLLGFKFLRLEDEPLAALRLIDGADAPRVTLPGGRPAGW